MGSAQMTSTEPPLSCNANGLNFKDIPLAKTRHSLRSCRVLFSMSLVVFSYPMCFVDLEGANHTGSITVLLRRRPAAIPPNFKQLSGTYFETGCDSNALIRCRINWQTKLCDVHRAWHICGQKNWEIINGTEIWRGMVTNTSPLSNSRWSKAWSLVSKLVTCFNKRKNKKIFTRWVNQD